MSYDAIVVGARPAGAATALLLARRGLRVLVIDQQPEGRDTLSTHAVMRAGVVQLFRWGLLDALAAQGTPALRGSTFHYRFPDDETSETVQTVETVDVRPAGGIDALYAPRRTVLDPLLVDAARRAGAEVRFATKVERLLVNTAGRVIGIEARGRRGPMRAHAPITIGADGVRSTVAQAVDARVTHRGRATGALAYRYVAGLPADRFNWYYAPGVTAGVIPTNAGVANVWAGVPSARFAELARPSLARGLDAVLARVAPEVAEQVRATASEGPVRGFPGVAGFQRVPVGPGWALVGDAGYFKDPITAHGITDALRDAELLADAVVLAAAGDHGAFAEYHRARDALSTQLRDVTERIAGYRWDGVELQGLLRDLSVAQRAENRWLAGKERQGLAPAA
jgi:flavin-dependent dehydrogenase